MPAILKSDGAFEVELLSKDMTDNGELNALVYAPEFRDVDGDIATAEVIKEMAYESTRNGVEIDIRHDNKPLGRDRAFVAESFIVQKGDPRFQDLTDYAGKPVDPTGAWGVVIKIDDPQLQKLYREGGWQGISMQGVAEVEHEKEDNQLTVEGIFDILASRLQLKKNNPTPEEDMAISAEDLTLISKAVAEAVAASLAKAAPEKPESKPAGKEDEGGQEQKAPIFKGNPADPAAVKKHVKAIRAYELKKTVDWSDVESVADYATALVAMEKEDENPEVIAAKAELAKSQAKLKSVLSASRQGTGSIVAPAKAPAPAGDQFFVDGLEKTDENQQCLTAGAEMAAFANASRGYGSK